MKNNWTIEKENPKLRDKLAKSLQISPITAQILVNRGIENETEANLFLNCTLFDLPSPYLMKGMDRAVERIKKALENNERIAIYGDYDVDGVTSTALLYSFLKVLKANVTYYNPDRLKEGYGINIDAVKKLAEQGVSLIISGDCGITAVKEIEQAKELGVEFIVTDHHKPPQELPRAVSILNPKLSECKYPGKEIVGVGVIFNLVIALRRALRDEGFFKNGEPNLGDYLDLVALGTVADCAPLLDVNRILVKEGIKRMQSPKRLGVQALKEASSIKGEVTSYDLGFKLGPRINASGRMSTAENAVALFISENLEEARELARELNEKNSNRQSTEAEIIKEAISLLESNPALIGANSIVLASRNWHPGIIGIVASRIVERYEKPTMLIAISEDGVGKGSGRSLEGINIYAALSECRELFLQFGGHEQAAGLSIREENVEKFREMFDKALENSEEQYEKKLKVDCSIELDSLTDSLISEFELLQPFGIGNPEPALLSRTVEVVSQRIFKDKHLGFKVKKGTKLFDAIWFNMKEPFTLPDKVDMVFTPEFNKWNGKKEIRLRVKDVSW
ncbi:MAG: single-stranded-DNA-specific exonuclease RecJ [Candidatus Dadabacteria bacterium]|nr:MAG: single-stranded-DNA-specific exonuclease RecJ [Candidatus Dadabacteria bacterium]